MTNALRFCGLLVLNFLVSLMAPAALQSIVWGLIPAHTAATVLWKIWTLSIGLAAVIGFGMWRTWHSNAAKWTWTLPSIWLAVAVLAFIGAGQSSVFSPSPTSQIGSLFSGRECVYDNSAVGYRYFYLFTIPFIRGVAYSAGAFVSSRIFNRSATILVA
jgi:hypothetical protein